MLTEKWRDRETFYMWWHRVCWLAKN